jgi:hypothetical protein
MDNCLDIFGMPETCREQGGLTLQTDEEMNACTKQVQVEEVTEGQCESDTSTSPLLIQLKLTTHLVTQI